MAHVMYSNASVMSPIVPVSVLVGMYSTNATTAATHTARMAQ